MRDGFYWVKWQASGLTQVAHRFEGKWFLTGTERPVATSQILVLSGALVPPAGVTRAS